MDALPTPRPRRCVLVWRAPDDEQPSNVVVGDGETEALFAWLATYAPHIVPLTGYCDVVEREWLDRPRARLLVDDDATLGGLGFVQAETMIACGGEPPLRTGLTPFRSTCSWALFRRLRTTSVSVSSQAIFEKWNEARTILKAARIGYDVAATVQAWRIARVALADGQEMPIDEGETVAAELILSLRRGFEGLGEVRGTQEFADSLHATRRGSLETRVDAFKAMLTAIDARPATTPLHDVIVGYALHQISQGSFQHANLITGARRLASSLMWYAWFEYSDSANEGHALMMSSASRRLLALSRVEDASTGSLADVSLDELRVLARGRDALSAISLDLRHPVRVQLAPGSEALVQPQMFDKTPRTTQRSESREQLALPMASRDGPRPNDTPPLATSTKASAMRRAYSLTFNEKVRIEKMHRDQGGTVVQHDYRLTATLRNDGTRTARSWHIDVEIPTLLLIPGVDYGSKVDGRSGPKTTLLRLTNEGRPLLRPGDAVEMQVMYRVDDEVFHEHQEVFTKEITATAYVDDQLAAIHAQPVQKMTNF